MRLTHSKFSIFILVIAVLNIVYIFNQLSFADESKSREGSSHRSRRAISGIGLRGEYFNNIDFTDLKMIRIDPYIHFNWGSRGPNWRLKKDSFSVRWTGQVQPRFSETYAFSTFENDGVRVWINDELIINDWAPHSNSVKSLGYINLIGGVKYNIKIEYFELSGNALVRLYWASPSQRRGIVPQDALYPTLSNEVSPTPSPLPTPTSLPVVSLTPIPSPSTIPDSTSIPPLPTLAPSSIPSSQPSADLIYLRPIGDSPEQDWECFSGVGPSSVHYPLVNEELSDDPGTYCRKDINNSINSGRRNIYKLPPVGNLGTITNVSVVTRGRKDNINAFPVNLKIGIRSPNHSPTEFDGAKEFPVDNLWRNYEVSFGAINPATGLQWTTDDINNLEIFHKLGSIPVPFGEKLVVTQIYLKIEYTPLSISARLINYLDSSISLLFGSVFNIVVYGTN